MLRMHAEETCYVERHFSPASHYRSRDTFGWACSEFIQIFNQGITRCKIRPARTAMMLLRSNQWGRGPNPEIGNQIELTSMITCRPNLLVRDSLAPSIWDVSAACERRDRRKIR